MRAVLVLLVAANLLALAWWQGWLDGWLASSREPARVEQQIAPERLRVVPVERLDAALAALKMRCLEVGPLEDAVLQRIALWAAGLGDRAQGELARPFYRISLVASDDEAEIRLRSAELARLAGREPVACVGSAEPAPAQRTAAGRR